VTIIVVVRQGVAKILEEIAVLLELKGENPYKSRAYYGAARTVELIGDEELERLAREDRLKEVKGIGAALNEKIKELVINGNLTYYDELRRSVPAGLLEIIEVPGLGPKKVRTLYEILEITTLAELEYACRENRLLNLKGFGPKSQDNILEGIEFFRRNQGRFFYSEARSIASQLLSELSRHANPVEISLAGSIRRCLEIVKDIDIVAATSEPQSLAKTFSELHAVKDIIAMGETKVSVKLEKGINADMRVVRPDQYPYALHHFTGSKEHNTAMRHRAKKIGFKINEYGLYREQELITCRDEDELFNTLGLAYIPPELRENNGEIEAAEKGTLPDLVKPGDIRGVFHVHSLYSDGKNSLEDIVMHCLQLGYQYVGISDHSQSAFYAGGLNEVDLARQREEIEGLRLKYPDIGIFCGVESDILADGSLDYPDSVLEKLDFVIASVHSALKMERSRITERVLKALEHPKVTMLGHPTNRLLLGRASSDLDLDSIFRKAAEKGIVLELNANPARLDLDWRHLKKIKEMGIQVSINPDAHQLEGFSDTALGVAVARKGWLEKKDVFNCRNRSEIELLLFQGAG
jgi:DNA polymerase (family X)